MRIKCKRTLTFLLAVCLMFTSVLSVDLQVHAENEDSAVVIDVTDYGADPTGVKDSAIAIQEAIEAAKDVEGEVIINFPTGRYDIYPDKAAERELYISNTVGSDQSYKDKKIGILIEDMENVTVEGNGSLFMFHGKMMTFAAIRSENVVFQNFQVNFQVPTVVDITVEKIEDNTAVIYVPECYNYEIGGTTVKWLSDASPYTGETYWTTTGGMNYCQIYDVKTGLTKRASNPVFSNVSSIEDIGSHRLKFTYSSLPSGLGEGLCYQMRPTVRDHAGTFFWQSKDVTLENLDIYFLHGFGMVGQHSENITLNDVDFEAPKESGRTTAGYADFIQMSGCKGLIDISNCTFANPHDDPINIHGTFNQVVEVISETQIRVQYKHNETAGFPNFFVGDEVEFIKKSDLNALEGTWTVTAVDGPDGMGGDMGEGSGSLTDIILTFDKAIPSEVAANTHVVENITYTPDVHIHNNIFKETPTRGILCTTRGEVVIENNVIDGMGMAGIYISDDANGWYESGATKNVTIRNNVFTRGQAQAIYVQPTNSVSSSTEPIHINMTIEGNTFFMNDQKVVDAKSVRNLTFKNNTIYRQNANVTIDLTADDTDLGIGESTTLTASASGTALNIRVYNFNGCRNVEISRNTYDDGLNLGVAYASMDASEIIVTDDPASVGLDQKVAAVKKIYYESSDKSVIKVSANGTVTAVGEGTADVTAYTVAAGRRYEAESLTFTAAKSEETLILPTAIEVADTKEEVQVGETLTYTATVLGEDGADKSVTWSVVDAETGNATDAAAIENGVLTAQAGGVVEVIAKTVNGLEARKLLAIQHEVIMPADHVEVLSPTNNGADVTWNETSIKITVNGNGLYQEQVPANVVTAGLEGDLTNVTATVKVEGTAPVNGNNWAAVGIYLMKDTDNYVSTEKKYRGGSGVAYGGISETSQRATEKLSSIGSEVETCYLKIEKTGDTAAAYYSLDGSEWTLIAENMSASQIGDSFSLGFAALGSGAQGCEYTFSELTVNGEAVTLTKMGERPADPTVSMSYDADANKAVVTQDADNAVVKWAVADSETGAYSLVADAEGEELILTQEMKDKYVKAAVTARNSVGMVGNVVWTDAVLVTGEGEESSNLTGRSGNAALKTAEILGYGEEETSLFEFEASNFYYFTQAGVTDRVVKVKFEAEDAGAAVKTLFNDAEVEGNEGTLTLTSGRNLIEVIVTAEDGVTKSDYRFTISRTGDGSAELTSLSVNGNAVQLKDGVYAYAYKYETWEAGETVIAAESNAASVEIIQNRQVIEDGKVSVGSGTDEVIIKVTSETSAAPTIYTLKFYAALDEVSILGKELLLRKSGEVLKACFEIEAQAGGEQVTGDLGFEWEIKEPAEGVSISQEGVLMIEDPENIDKVVICVIYQGEMVAEKMVRIIGGEEIYLSDLEWQSASCGWTGRAVQKDQAVSQQPLRLADEDGNPVSYEKGLGTHAESKIVYDIEDQGYDVFYAMVGIDYDKYTSGEPNANFQVYFDGNEDEIAYESGSMVGSTPQKEIFIRIPEGAKTITLYVDQGAVNWSDHADWADAKFIRVQKADLEALQEMMAAAEEKLEGSYEETLMEQLREAMETAEAVCADTLVTQKEADEALAELTAAYEDILAAEVEAVMEAIREIGEVSLESKEDIEQARAAYEALTETQKLCVSNRADLEAAEKSYLMLWMEDAVQKAEEAQKKAEAAQEEAEKAQAAAEEAQKKAEEAQAEAEKAQAAAEAAAAQAGADSAEAQKKAEEAEAAQKEAEAERLAAEEAKKEAEAERLAAEEAKKAAKEAQKAAEEARNEATKLKEEMEKLKEKISGQNTNNGGNTESTKLGKVSLKSVKAQKKGRLKVTWKKVEGATGYEIVYAANAKFKNAVTKQVSAKKASLVLKKLKSGKKYYVKVRALKKTENETVYGAFSKRKKKRTK